MRLTAVNKNRARSRVQAAVASGRLVRPEHCDACGEQHEAIHGHHRDYAKPLEVDWLCLPCHYQLHRELGRDYFSGRGELRDALVLRAADVRRADAEVGAARATLRNLVREASEQGVGLSALSRVTGRSRMTLYKYVRDR